MNIRFFQLVISTILALGVGLSVGYYFGYDIGFEKGATPLVKPQEQTKPATKEETFDLVKVSNVQTGDVISSPVKLRGEAVGSWFFEASFPIDITDLDGNILGQGFVQAQSEWMTTDFVPYEGEISFDPQGDTQGYIVFRKDNPSGLPEYDDFRRLQVSFE